MNFLNSRFSPIIWMYFCRYYLWKYVKCEFQGHLVTCGTSMICDKCGRRTTKQKEGKN